MGSNLLNVDEVSWKLLNTSKVGLKLLSDGNMVLILIIRFVFCFDLSGFILDFGSVYRNPQWLPVTGGGWRLSCVHHLKNSNLPQVRFVYLPLLDFRRSSHFLVKNMGRSSRTLYVGNLPGDIREREIEDLFYKYGPIVEIDLKIPPRPPVFAFVEFEDPRDAEDAICGRDGYKFDGQRLRVEFAHGGRASSSIDRHSSGGGSHGGLSRRTDYRVYVTGLPSSASWQDLKVGLVDILGQIVLFMCFRILTGFFFKKNVIFRITCVELVMFVSLKFFRDRDGMRGIVDYTNYDDMKYAVRKLDDSLFRNHFSKAYIRVEEYDSRRHNESRSRSPSPYYSRSRSPSHSYSSDSRSRSRSRSVSYRSKSASRCGFHGVLVDS
ncbi:unnamed protein product [Lactuca virosa]|uniref:RRM domain-containing protein n=1 Tax=Lactuca virosa TaxID=75947 RepID=A0AAU9LWU2_9ASTR|nr:unnamed protein product [Lactuca virosa]